MYEHMYIKAFTNRKNRNPSNSIIDEEFLQAFNKLAPLQPVPPLSHTNIQRLISIPDTDHLDIGFMLTPFSTREYQEAIATLKIR